ncbi:hypothetical protein TNCV_3371531 [Trichonephila clavipes]|nr:hypothetical protein TNCV_3371531 [Trichonephila clavipes]
MLEIGVAVRVYRTANTRWKFGTIVNQDGVLTTSLMFKEPSLRRHVDRSVQWGIKCKENIIPLMHQEFPSSESSAKETDSETRCPPVPDRPLPRRSGRIRRPPEG